jgi:hypothetical protein
MNCFSLLRHKEEIMEEDRKTEEIKNLMETALEAGDIVSLESIPEDILASNWGLITSETFRNLANKARLLKPKSKYSKVLRWFEDRQTWKEELERE